MLLPSRKYPSPEEFVEDFLSTITPGIIPRKDFIQWDAITKKLLALAPYVSFYEQMRYEPGWEQDPVRELADALLACDDPLPYLKCAFELLGHTDEELVTRQDDLHIPGLAEAIGKGVEDVAEGAARLLLALGLKRVLERKHLKDLLMGVQIGLESHRRKNVGGKCFELEVGKTLRRIVQEVSERTGIVVEVGGKRKINYGEGLNKKVDFTITVKGQMLFGIETNFYTTPGSKPTEIKRSYGNIRRGFLEVGLDLIWVTDGKGYRGMRRSLRDAYVILPNIYNLHQLRQHLADDLIEVLRERLREK